jgi:hypothetical protein
VLDGTALGLSDGTGSLAVGLHNSGGVDAVLGELRVYDTALSADQIRAIVGAGSVAFA